MEFRRNKKLPCLFIDKYVFGKEVRSECIPRYENVGYNMKHQTEYYKMVYMLNSLKELVLISNDLELLKHNLHNRCDSLFTKELIPLQFIDHSHICEYVKDDELIGFIEPFNL